MDKTLSGTQRMVLRTLDEAGEPLFNGTLGARTGLRFNSEVFASLRRLGLIEGHPIKLTDAGRAAIDRPHERKATP
jgi:hypothetical protein